MRAMNLLLRLLDLLLPPRTGALLVREATSESLARLVTPLTIPSLPFPTTALLPYQHPLIQALIVELKFHRSKKAATLLGSVLGDYLMGLIADRNEYEKTSYIVVPVPLSTSRRKSRGHNQLETLAAVTHFPGDLSFLPDTLTRIRDTAAQTSLSGSERLGNMQGVFKTTRPLNPAYTYIVFDDVTTTGATLQAAVTALLKGGARNIIPLALAH